MISATLRAIDIWSAILLLTGQINVRGVFFSSGSMWLSMTGPIFGAAKVDGTTKAAKGVLEGISVVTAMLLILGQITNTGPWISSGVFNMVLSGPAFGNPDVPVPADPSETSKQSEAFFSQLRHEIMGQELLHHS